MNRWLFKTDPETYSWDDLVKAKRDVWDGVANPLALKHLRQVKKGDEILIYHTGEEKAVIGIAKALSNGYPDPKNQAGAKGVKSKSVVVDLASVRALTHHVRLSEIKANKIFSTWELVRMSRLSVMPATEAYWSEVLHLSRSLCC